MFVYSQAASRQSLSMINRSQSKQHAPFPNPSARHACAITRRETQPPRPLDLLPLRAAYTLGSLVEPIAAMRVV